MANAEGLYQDAAAVGGQGGGSTQPKPYTLNPKP